VIGGMTARGKPVVVPSADGKAGLIGLEHGAETSIAGLGVRAFSVVHGEEDCRLYEVTLPNGTRVVHTGDMGTSESLPPMEPPDVLLLNCWVNEVGTRPDWSGVSRCLKRAKPKVTILGHAQEMGHVYDIFTVTTRRPYEWSLQTQARLGADRVKVLMWGEQYVLEAGKAGSGSE
jgi:hypothetical protein